jgi:hypothetical protein
MKGQRMHEVEPVARDPPRHLRLLKDKGRRIRDETQYVVIPRVIPRSPFRPTNCRLKFGGILSIWPGSVKGNLLKDKGERIKDKS